MHFEIQAVQHLRKSGRCPESEWSIMCVLIQRHARVGAEVHRHYPGGLEDWGHCPRLTLMGRACLQSWELSGHEGDSDQSDHSQSYVDARQRQRSQASSSPSPVGQQVQKKGSAKPISPRQASTCLLRKALSNKQEPLLSPGLRPGGVSQRFLISYTLAQSEITNQAEKETALSRGLQSAAAHGKLNSGGK